jgi:chaperonin cofactor prefoldin
LHEVEHQKSLGQYIKIQEQLKSNRLSKQQLFEMLKETNTALQPNVSLKLNSKLQSLPILQRSRNVESMLYN